MNTIQDQQLLEKMKNSQIVTKIDLSKNEKLLKIKTNNIVKQIKFLDKLKKMEEFLNSESWKTLEKSKEGHDVGYEYFKQLFKGHKVLFYDNGNVTNDENDLFSKLDEDQKRFLSKIDSNKKSGIFKCKNAIFTHIGSTAVISFSQTNIGEIILESWINSINKWIINSNLMIQYQSESFVGVPSESEQSFISSEISNNEEFFNSSSSAFRNLWFSFNSDFSNYESGNISYSDLQNTIISEWNPFIGAVKEEWRDIINSEYQEWKQIINS